MTGKKKMLSMIMTLAFAMAMLVAMTVTATANSNPTLYQVWVGGTQVTSDNKDHVLGDEKVKYDPTSNTLTLDGASIEAALSGNGHNIPAGIYADQGESTDPFNIVLNGKSTISGSADTSKPIMAGINVNGNLQISSSSKNDGSLDININGNESPNEPRGIQAKIIDINNCKTNIKLSGAHKYTEDGRSTGFPMQSFGLFGYNSISINNADVDVDVPVGQWGIATGIYVDTTNRVGNDGHLDIMGNSQVNVVINAEDYNPNKKPLFITGISGNEEGAAAGFDQRHGWIVLLVKDSATLNVDLTGVTDVKSSSVGIFGEAHAYGNSKTTVKGGQYGAGSYPKNGSVWIYARDLTAEDYAVVELSASISPSFGSVEAWGNSKVILKDGIAGTYENQWAWAKDHAEIIASGTEYGISGIVRADGDSIVEATGGTRAVGGKYLKNETVPFDPDTYGKLVNLEKHSSKTASVKKSLDSQDSLWDGTTALGGNDSPYRFVRIPAFVKVTGITLNKTAMTLNKGASETLRATVKPDNAADKTVIWTSDNKNVAVVDGNGKVTAVAAGTARITATAADGSGVKASCTVSVTEPAPAANAPVVTTTAKTSTRSTTIKWTWNAVDGASKYKVAYHKVGSKKWKVKTTKKTKYVLKGQKIKGLYEYKVAAVTASGDVWSDTSCRYFKTVKAKAKFSKGALKVSWKKDKGAAGYEIFIARNKKMDGAQVIQVAPASKSYSVTGLEKGRYYVKVRPMKNYNGVTYTGILCKARKAKVK